MQNLILVFIFFVSSTFCLGQNIDLTPALPGPELYSADVGDLMLADVDNDGDNDLISIGGALGGEGTQTDVYINDGNGNFSELTAGPFINVRNGVIELGDVNNDNFLDIYIQGSTGGGTKVANLYINDGAGNFTLPDGQPFGERSEGDATFGDVDNDGDLDLLTTGVMNFFTSDPFTTLFLNDGSGNFTEATGTPFEVVSLSSVEFIDVENDGDLDVILHGRDANDNHSTTFYTNDGAGNFTQMTDSFEDFSGGQIAIGDSDNDGDVDILMTGSTSLGDITQLYINDGSGNYSLSTSTTLPGAVTGETKFGDFDSDGDLDVLISGVSSDVIADIYENTGSNNFLLADKLGKAYLSCFAIGDIDGDNDLDAIIGGTSFTSPARATKTYLNTLINEAELLLDFECMTLTYNSFSNPFVIQGGISDYTVEILDVAETVIQTITPTTSKVSVDINTLPVGFHFLRVVNNLNGQVVIQIILNE